MDNDGEFDDATGAIPTITFDEPYSGNIHLEVTDDNGATDIDSTSLTVLISATIDFDPDTLNLQSKGKWVTTYIELPECYDLTKIDVSTIKLNDEVQAEDNPREIGDYDDDGIDDLMVKFDRSTVQEILEVGEEVEITVTGKVAGTSFEGSDTIRVIDE